MTSSGSSCGINRKKINVRKMKRKESKNQKKVWRSNHGDQRALRDSVKSKKKQRKDSKRRRNYAEAEKDKMLRDGLITQEDVDKLEKEEKAKEEEEAAKEESMDVDESL